MYPQTQQFNAIRQRATCFGYSHFNCTHPYKNLLKFDTGDVMSSCRGT